MAITETFPAYTGTALSRTLSESEFNDAEEYFQSYHQGFVPLVNDWATQANALAVEVNDNAVIVVAKEALMNPHYTAIDAVYANETNVNLVADDITNVNTTAGSIANVNLTAGSITNVNLVGDDITNVNSVATTIVPNITEILQADDNATICTTKAGEAAQSATDAETAQTGAEAALDAFDDKYLGAKASDPTLDNDGDPLQMGATYYNTTTDEMKVYDTDLTAWAAISFVPTAHNSLSGRTDSGGHTIAAITDLQTTLDAKADLSGAIFAGQVSLKKGADVASATALPVLTDGNYFDVTGTTTVTSINTTGTVGTVIKLHFDGALILTHNATDLILPSGANITTAVGDEAEFVEYASGDFRCTVYTKADGTAVVSPAGGIGEFIDTSIAISSDDSALANDDGTNNNNIAIGVDALATITSGANNFAAIAGALEDLDTGSHNVAINGGRSLNGAASYNVAIGLAMSNWSSGNTTGSYNTGIGYQTGFSLTTGQYNVLNGYQAGYSLTTGQNDINIGYQAGYSDQTGSYHINIGGNAGHNVNGFFHNVMIGRDAGRFTTVGGTGAFNNGDAIAIGRRAYVTAAGEMSLGNETYITAAYTAVAFATRSDERLKDFQEMDLGLDFINKLEPKKYKWNDGADLESINYGFSAQQVKKTLDESGVEGKTKMHLVRGEAEDAIQNLTYTELLAPMVKAIQEQQVMIQELQAEIKTLKGQ